MSDKKIQTLDNVRAFLDGTTDIDFSIERKDECYQWIRTTLVRFRYLSLARIQRGLIQLARRLLYLPESWGNLL